MQCKTFRAKAAFDDDGAPVVHLVVGNMRAVGAVDEVGWMELGPGMAREVAQNILDAVDDVERLRKLKAQSTA